MAIGWRPLPVASAAANYSLSVDAGAFTLTGVAALFGNTITNATVAYTLTGQSAGIGNSFPAAAGTFTETGVAATFGRTLTCATGSYTLTGIDATPALFVGVIATAVPYTLTGNAANFDRGLTAAVGAYTETGQSAGIGLGIQAAASLVFAETGNANDYDIKMVVAAGTFTLTGVAATLSAPGAPPTVTYVTHVEATGITANPFTASAVGIGTATSDRIVVAAIGLDIASLSVSDGHPSAVTIGGVSATKAVSFTNSSTGSNLSMSLWSAPVPTGTTGDIVVTQGAVAFAVGLSYSIGTWALTGVSNTVSDTATASANPASLNIDVHKNDIAIGAGLSFALGAGYAWTGLTENYDYTLTANHFASGASLVASTATIPLTVTAAGTLALYAAVSAVWPTLNPIQETATGTFTETGVAALFNNKLTALVTPYVLTGQAASFASVSHRRSFSYIFR